MRKAAVKARRDEQHQQVNHHLKSLRFEKWLAEVLFELSDGVKYTRQQIVELTDTPCTRSARMLHDACQRYRIRTIADLNHVGMQSLQRCQGIGERSTLIAAYILAEYGYSIDQWMRRPGLSLEAGIKLVYSRARKQKH